MIPFVVIVTGILPMTDHMAVTTMISVTPPRGSQERGDVTFNALSNCSGDAILSNADFLYNFAIANTHDRL